jgi:O-antigen/teichoic acid export membrane protein
MNSNSEINKRIAKNTLALYFCMLFTMGVSLYTSRVILRVLGVEDFGVYNIVGGIVVLFGFLNTTLAQGTQRFLSFQLGKNDQEKLKNTFSAALIMHVALALIIIFIAETAGLWLLTHKLNIPTNRKSAAFLVFQFSIFASAVNIIQTPFNAVIIAHEKMNIYAFVNVVEALLKLLIVYLLIIASNDKLIIFAALTFAIRMIIISIYWTYCRKRYRESLFQIVTDKKLYSSMFSFSGWFVILMGSGYVVTYGTDVILNVFFGPVANAARAIAAQVNNAVTSFVNNFQTAINPNIFKLYAADRTEELLHLILQSAKFSFCLVWIFILPLLLKLDFVISIWLGTAPEYTVLFCRILLIQSLITCTTNPFFYGIQAIGTLRPVAIVGSILWNVSLGISYLVAKFSMPAYAPLLVCLFTAAIAVVFYVRYFCIFFNLSIKRLGENLFYPILLIIMCSLPVSYVVNYYLRKGFFSFMSVSLVAVSSTVISVYYFAFDKVMRLKILNKISGLFCIRKSMAERINE